MAYPVEEPASLEVFVIRIETILKIASQVISKRKVRLGKFMNVYVEVEGKWVNVFRLKRQGGEGGAGVKLKREDNCFYLNVWVVDIARLDKTNPLL